MQAEIILTIDDPSIREECIIALRATKTPFIEMTLSQLESSASSDGKVLVWGLKNVAKESLKMIQRYAGRNSNQSIVLMIPKNLAGELTQLPASIVEGIVTLPADSIFLNQVLEHANNSRVVELEIRSTREKISQLENEFDVFLKIGRAIASSLELNKVLTSIMSISGKLIESEAWSLALIDPETDELVFEAAQGEYGKKVRGLRIPKGKGVIGWVAEQGEPLIVADTTTDVRHYKEVDKNVGFQSKSILCLPLKARGKVLGAIEFINKLKKGQFSHDDIERVKVFVDLAAVSIENALLYRRMARLSECDELTGLFNQRTLMTTLMMELEKAFRSDTTLAYLFLDLDRFKLVNDRLGHLMGRETLREAGQVLRKAAGDKCILARYGGDEFCIILPGLGREEGILIAEKIRQVFENHIFLKNSGYEIRLTVSIGVALYPEHAQTFDEITRIADQAMSHAKQKARNMVYCPEIKRRK